MKIDPPSIMEGARPEQNVRALKGWAEDVSYKLTQTLTEMESTIEALKSEIEELKEAGDGV